MKLRSTLLIGFLAVLACTTTAPRPEPNADLILTGGTVVTMAGPNIENGAVAIRDGVLLAVGTADAIDSAYTAVEVVDARGMAILPGLINAHTHAPMVLFRGIADDRDLMDWLQNFIFPAEAKNVDAEFVRWGTRLAAAEMIRSGTTTFADMYYFEADVAREARSAGLRGVLGETMLDFPAPDNKTWDEAVAYVRAYVAEFRNDALITPALAPHAPFTVSREHLQQVRALATELGVPILIHVSETTDELKQVAERAEGMTPGKYLESIGFLGPDVIAAHGVWLTSEEIHAFARAGVGVVHNPESNMMLASGVASVVEMRSSGVDLGLGTDGPAGSNNNLDMFEEMASAARLQKIIRRDPKAIGARDVLEMATIGGARALGLADKVGSLEPGKRADVILVDLRAPKTQPVYSVESAIVYSASGADVVMTIVDGKVLMRDRKVLTVDIPAVLEKAREYRDRISASVTSEE